jgi:pimeloyl-ACP methyl ester carboxylesterase
VLGPFENPLRGSACLGFSRDYLAASGGEAAAHPQKGSKVGELSWRLVEGPASGLNFGAVYPGITDKVAYAYREFNWPSATRAVLRVGSDDGAKIWLNGTLVYARHLHRSLSPGEDAVAIDLKAGMNRLLVKVDQGSGEWGFSTVIADYAAEDALVAKAKLQSLTVSLAEDTVPVGGSVIGWVGSSPSFALSGTFTVRACDESGKLMREFKAEASRPFSFSLPASYSGIVSFNVVPSGAYARLRAAGAYAIAGEPEPVFARASKSARDALAHIPQGRRFSTLSFLASQLEGKTDPSLATFARQTAAAYRVAELVAAGVDESTEFTGLRQWAYRSSLDGSDQPYSLYLPASYNPSKAYPLIACLHGYTGNDFDQAKSVANLAPDDYLIVAPFGRGDLGYGLQGERDVMDVLDQVQARYKVDPDRVYLMGVSMGGMGTWRLGQLYSDRFAAIAPFCGWSGTDSLGNLGGLGVLIVHGDSDPTVPDYFDRQAASTLSSIGTPPRFDSLRGVGHDAWNAWANEFGGDTLFKFFSAHKRNPWPMKVSLTAPRELYGKKAWVKIDAFSLPRSPARLNAEIIDGRHLEVVTEGVKAFSLDLSHPALEKKGRVLVRVNGFDIPAETGKQARFSQEPGSERFSFIKGQAIAAPRNDGGGLADLCMRPLYVVVGTKDKRSAKSLALFAKKLCDWRPSPEMGIGSKVGDFRVIQDKELSPAMAASASLLLLGSAKENAVTARLAAAFPATFDPDKVSVAGKTYKNAGLIMARPHPEAEGQLLGVISLPKNGKLLDRFAEGLGRSLRLYRMVDNDIPGVMTPDVMVFDRQGSILYQASYDSEWKELVPGK